ncbi:hypothetical protein Tco_1073118 [Tanacetum coccineum]
MGKGLLGPNGDSGGKFKCRFDEHCSGNGGIGGSMSGVGEGIDESIGRIGGGSLARCSMVSNDGRGGGGLVIAGGRSSREVKLNVKMASTESMVGWMKIQGGVVCRKTYSGLVSKHVDFMPSSATTLTKHVMEVRHVIWMYEIQDVVWRVGKILISKIWW